MVVAEVCTKGTSISEDADYVGFLHCVVTSLPDNDG